MSISLYGDPNGTSGSIKIGTSTAATFDATGVTLPANATQPLQAVTLQQAQSLIINGSLGVSQTWQDVKASRSLGTTYTNSTGKPIQVSVSISNSSGSSGGSRPRVGFYVGSVRVCLMTVGDANGSNFADFTVNGQMIVPAGSTYSVSYVDGTNNLVIVDWSELK